MSAEGPRQIRVALPDRALEEMRERLARTRWPDQPQGVGWSHGADLDYLRSLCEHWRGDYDWAGTERALNGLSNWGWDGLHFIWERATDAEAGDGPLPILLVHGWPGAPLELTRVIPLLVRAGHDVVVPSLPGYAFSQAPERPLNVAAVAARLRALMEDALGYRRYAVQGGDWGAVISARIAWEAPERVAALHTNAVGLLSLPGSLEQPPLSEAERRYIEEAQRWRLRDGFHVLVQSRAPDALAVGMQDSPAGLAAWLVEKYRRWSDCDGEVERRFSRDELCDFLTIYWATGTIASSLRLYAAEARDRWRLAPGERITVPAAAAEFPAEILRPPREWAERILADLRRWTELPRGGHFAAWEEPQLLAEDVIAFLDGLE